MGGEIECIGSVSEPNYYLKEAQLEKESPSFLWHSRRRILAEIMNKVGFVQHPNEWWHFSYGDQLWAWLKKVDVAYYGTIDDSESSSNIV